jgi:hypothetical protein
MLYEHSVKVITVRIAAAFGYLIQSQFCLEQQRTRLFHPESRQVLNRTFAERFFEPFAKLSGGQSEIGCDFLHIKRLKCKLVDLVDRFCYQRVSRFCLVNSAPYEMF